MKTEEPPKFTYNQIYTILGRFFSNNVASPSLDRLCGGIFGPRPVRVRETDKILELERRLFAHKFFVKRLLLEKLDRHRFWRDFLFLANFCAFFVRAVNPVHFRALKSANIFDMFLSTYSVRFSAAISDPGIHLRFVRSFII